MTRRPTIRDVAAAAGVSKSTVSLVLQRSPLIRAETAAEVRAAMDRVGYLYNRAAANLRSADAGLVGLVINDLRNPFFTEFATSFQMALAEHGLPAVIANTGEDPAMQARVVRSMIEHGVDALVISPTFDAAADTFDLLARAGVPTIQVLRRGDPRTGLFPFASFDYAGGSRQATRHLLEAGARRVAFVGGFEGRQITDERMAGYLAEMAAAGLAPTAILGATSRRWGFEAAAPRIAADPGIDAVLGFNDLAVLGLMAGLARAGRGDVRLVGFDDIEECALVWPQLSSVSCDIGKFGRDTAARIVAWLERGERPPAEHREPVRLVPRGSSR